MVPLYWECGGRSTYRGGMCPHHELQSEEMADLYE